MLSLIVAPAAAAAGLVVGTIWGRKMEQNAVGAILGEFHKVDAEARAAVNRLLMRLPYVKKHL